MPSCSSARTGLFAVSLLLLTTPVDAGLPASRIDEVGVALPAEARVPTSVALIDETGTQRSLGEGSMGVLRS